MVVRQEYSLILELRDFLEVQTAAFEKNDEKAKLIFDALVYQHAKDIGTMAAVLKFEVDAIILTGGMANKNYFVAQLNLIRKKLLQ